MLPKDHSYHNYRLGVPEEFKAVFSHFYFAKNDAAEVVTKTLLPSFQTIMVFNFGTRARLVSGAQIEIEVDKCMVLGPIKSAFKYILTPGACILVANFKDDAFYRFFGRASLSGHLPVNPNEIVQDNCFTNLWYQLNDIDTAQEKVNYILDFCKPYLQSSPITASLLSNFKSDSLNPVKSIAKQTGQSERNVQLGHKKYFGYSAKEINRYRRFVKAIGVMEKIASSSAAIDWFEMIHECGYYDQSQMIHDFKHFINLSPKKFLRFQQDICRVSTE
ncbi:AraC family transcriptional regulator [Niabella sp. 22666]|uniref:AraC family transcriptional regulator n=1 Tax=Niabella sp. 22666 TaxID=3453954 RepID=UPI003F8474C0